MHGSWKAASKPWLQGFRAVSMSGAYVSFGTAIATAPVLTGLGIVDAAKVDATIAGVAAGFRYALGRRSASLLPSGAGHFTPQG